MMGTRNSIDMENELSNVREQSRVFPRVMSLMNRVDVPTLFLAHREANGRKARGMVLPKRNMAKTYSTI